MTYDKNSKSFVIDEKAEALKNLRDQKERLQNDINDVLEVSVHDKKFYDIDVEYELGEYLTMVRDYILDWCGDNPKR